MKRLVHQGAPSRFVLSHPILLTYGNWISSMLRISRLFMVIISDSYS